MQRSSRAQQLIDVSSTWDDADIHLHVLRRVPVEVLQARTSVFRAVAYHMAPPSVDIQMSSIAIPAHAPVPIIIITSHDSTHSGAGYPRAPGGVTSPSTTTEGHAKRGRDKMR